MARPRQSDPAIVAVAAHELAERTVEEWDRTGSVEDWVGPLSKEMRYSHRDGYELARELERYHGITPDSQLVELLDDTYSVVRSAYTDALTKWVKFTGWTPRYTKGDRVLWRGKPGIVNGVKAETSEMYFAPDEEAPRYNQGGGYVVVEDDLTPASAIEARSDETRSGWVMSETVRRRMYGRIVGMDWAIASHRSASLRAVPIFVVTALRAAAAIARGLAR